MENTVYVIDARYRWRRNKKKLLQRQITLSLKDINFLKTKPISSAISTAITSAVKHLFQSTSRDMSPWHASFHVHCTRLITCVRFAGEGLYSLIQELEKLQTPCRAAAKSITGNATVCSAGCFSSSLRTLRYIEWLGQSVAKSCGLSLFQREENILQKLI